MGINKRKVDIAQILKNYQRIILGIAHPTIILLWITGVYLFKKYVIITLNTYILLLLYVIN